MQFLLGILRPYKYETLLAAIIFVLPTLFLLSIQFKKIQSFIIYYCLWMMHRNPGFETVTFFFTEGMKGSQYGMSIHHVDLMMMVVFFACLASGDLRDRFKLFPAGCLIFFVFWVSSLFTGESFFAQYWIRSWFAIWAHLRMFLFYYYLSQILKLERIQRNTLLLYGFLIIFVGVNCLKLRYINGVQMPVGAYFTTYNQQGYIISSMTGIFFAMLLNQAQLRISNLFLYLAVSMSGLAAILSQNRGGQMNLFFTVFGVLALDLLLKLNFKKIKTIFILLLFGLAGLTKSYDTLYERYFGASKNPEGTSLRKAFYVRSYESFKRNYLTGLGANLYSTMVYEDPDAVEAALENDFYGDDPELRYKEILRSQTLSYGKFRAENPDIPYTSGVVESYWFLCLAEYGLIGFIPLVLTWFFFYYCTFRNAVYFRSRNIYYYSLSTGLFGTLTGCIIHNATEWCGRQTQTMYFIASYFALVSMCTYVRKRKSYDNIQAERGFLKKFNEKASTSVIADPV